MSSCVLLPSGRNRFMTHWVLISPHKQTSTYPGIIETSKLVLITPTRVVQETQRAWKHIIPSTTAIVIIGLERKKLWDPILQYVTALLIIGWVIPQSSSTVIFSVLCTLLIFTRIISMGFNGNHGKSTHLHCYNCIIFIHGYEAYSHGILNISACVINV